MRKINLTEILVQPTVHPLSAPHFFLIGLLWKLCFLAFFELGFTPDINLQVDESERRVLTYLGLAEARR